MRLGVEGMHFYQEGVMRAKKISDLFFLLLLVSCSSLVYGADNEWRKRKQKQLYDTLAPCAVVGSALVPFCAPLAVFVKACKSQEDLAPNPSCEVGLPVSLGFSAALSLTALACAPVIRRQMYSIAGKIAARERKSWIRNHARENRIRLQRAVSCAKQIEETRLFNSDVTGIIAEYVDEWGNGASAQKKLAALERKDRGRNVLSNVL